jgi:uncharacterized protein YggE
MSSKFLILPLAALAIISMAGAASAQVSPSIDPTTTSAILDTNNTIFVTGTATERFEPDRVTAIFAVETVNKTAGAALEGAGVRENETSTAYFSVYPNYNYTEFGEQKLTGYTVTNSIMVESADLSNV